MTDGEERTFLLRFIAGMARKPSRVLAATGVFFLIGFAAGWLAGIAWVRGVTTAVRGHELRLAGSPLVNPLLECEVSEDEAAFHELRPFREKIAALLQEKTAKYRLTHVSVYFRDLNNGPWFGINEKEDFAPASLLKVPTMIACLRQAEKDPSFLHKRIVYRRTTDYDAEQMIKPSRAIEPGKSYTVDELLDHAISRSDNNANVLLFDSMDRNILLETYRDLGVNPPTQGIPDDFMTVKEYASFFRVLFNASYLGKDMSVKALAYLAAADYRDGLVAGVPQSIVVAHKFGERALGDRYQIRELHDCGIVYYPGHPYLLCIMSKGEDFLLLDDLIRDVSRLVFEEVDGQHREGK